MNPDSQPILLNLGCGYRISEAFVNLDVVPRLPIVQEWDASKGIPYPDNSVHFVYHSHVLEHLTLQQAKAFVAESFRCLAPGGILRIVVPDLELACRDYLSSVEDLSSTPIEENSERHSWMVIELIDQLCRHQQGGQYLSAYNNGSPAAKRVIEQRIGAQPFKAVQAANNPQTGFPKRVLSSLRFRARRLRERIGSAIVGRENVEIGKFRNSGECHLWMYDRHNLKRLLCDNGFAEFSVVSAHESRLPEWLENNLDIEPDGSVARPNSLFAEAVKPIL
jgi:predicted SAM-dependent methyltransferase